MFCGFIPFSASFISFLYDWRFFLIILVVVAQINHTIQFDQSASTFRELTAYGKGGINVNQDLNTSYGALTLTFDDGYLDFAENVTYRVVFTTSDPLQKNSNHFDHYPSLYGKFNLSLSFPEFGRRVSGKKVFKIKFTDTSIPTTLPLYCPAVNFLKKNWFSCVLLIFFLWKMFLNE